MNFLKRTLRVGSIAFLIVLVIVVASNLWVVRSTKSLVLTDYKLLPDSGVALVLGTSHRLVNGSPNPFFHNRMATAAELYKEGKIVHFIVSGDNRTKYYNEPIEMQKALIRLGVPAEAITLDYAGLRTLDSIVRCKEIFGQTNITIITQPFHSYRALFISRYYHVDAVALVANEPNQEDALRVYVREYLARTKAILDLYILGTSPRHLGDKEPIGI
ncbi:MAG TPA: ElyC/SanA/YdcF family protein [Cyclobacteriaceae bacterium]|nr:ElyC/SanA/YdcF family protein [Cyclobacteriaceae bacterium]HRG79812.1 ElyC/SanA/YdcF family protein [Cyclobacteriaceae bacterium]